MSRAVNLDELGIVDVIFKGVVDGIEICGEAIRGELNAVQETIRNVIHKPLRAFAVPRSDEPANHQLRVGVDGRPSPNVAVAEFALLVGRKIFFLPVAEIPKLVALDSLGRQTTDLRIVEDLARLTPLPV